MSDWVQRRNTRPALSGIAGSVLIFLAAFGPGAPALPAADPVPLPRAHAHNDYLHARPLLDALDQGFCSVEADIHLVNGSLLVAHDRDQVRPGRTLESLYLIPLLQRARRFDGRIHPGGPAFTLLIDFKSEALSTYAVLRPVLLRYTNMLTRFSQGKIHTNAVTVVLSGNRPRAVLEQVTHRYAALDGRLPDLATNPPLDLVPLISDNWRNHFSWRGSGPLPGQDQEKLRHWVRTAHAQGRRIRFWAIPDRREAWALLDQHEVDYINTDRLADLAGFLWHR